MSNEHDTTRQGTTELGSLSDQTLTASANQYLEQNNLDKAYPYLAEYASRTRMMAEPANIAGVVATQLNRRDEAREHFVQALTASPDNYDASYNLALLDMTCGNVSAAIRRLRRLAKAYPADAGLHNDLGVMWQQLDRAGRTEVCFRRSLRRDANHTDARNNAMEFFLETGRYERARQFIQWHRELDRVNATTKAELDHWQGILDRRVMEESSQNLGAVLDDIQADLAERQVEIVGHEVGKVAIFATHPTFVSEIADELRKHNKVRFFRGGNARDLAELMQWADVAWFEWCDDLVIQASRLPKVCPIICRLHSYEAFTNMPEQVDWSKIDRLVFVNDSVRELVMGRLPAGVASTVITNGVNLEKFTVPPGKSYGKRMASVGYINYKKNPGLLLYCFKKIHAYDPEYSLHIAGEHQDPRISLYFEHFLRTNPLPVHFDGWVDDMQAWYADKDFVISTSLFESFHYSIAEGMASGVMPLIHDWYGAENLYPRRYLFCDPDDCLRLVRDLERSDRQSLADDNRAHIAQRFNHRDKVNEIMQLLAEAARVSSPARQGV